VVETAESIYLKEKYFDLPQNFEKAQRFQSAGNDRYACSVKKLFAGSDINTICQ